MVLIVVDGLDSSGKSTQALRLCNFLRNRGKTVCLRFHPSNDNFSGVKAKQFLFSRGKSAHFTVAFFYMLDVIRSILLYSWRKYDYIIFTRYLMGTAYLPQPLHKIAYHFFATIVPTSEYMFFLDVCPEEAYQRIQQTREKREIFESLEELKLIRRKAFSLALTGKWIIVDANESIRDVEKDIREYVVAAKVDNNIRHVDARVLTP